VTLWFCQLQCLVLRSVLSVFINLRSAECVCSYYGLRVVAIGNPERICAKLRTVAASNNRVHMPWSLYYCLFVPHICMVLFFTHIPFAVNHIINATPPERLQQHPLLFTTNRTDRTFFVWRLNSARRSHPGHSTIVLRSEIPSGICAKLHTVAASNNRVHMPWSLYYCLFAPHVWCCSSRTSRSWWIAQSTQHHQRGCSSVCS